MIRTLALAAAALALASPAFAFSFGVTPPGTQPAAGPADPDEALSGLYKQFAGAEEPTARQTPMPRGAMVTYDLPTVGRGAEAKDGLADLSAHPGDPDFNPFMTRVEIDRATPSH